MLNDPPKFIRISQVASDIGFSKSTIRSWIKKGIFIEPLNKKLPNCCKTTELFFLRSEYDNWLSQFNK